MSRLASVALGAMAALAFGMADETNEVMSDAPTTRPARNFHKPSGSKPVPGGGARERERALRRMAKAEAKAISDRAKGDGNGNA